MISIAAVLAVITFSSYENGITGFGLDRTGAPPTSYGTCSDSVMSCHVNSSFSNLVFSIILTDPQGNIVSNSTYMPDTTYRVTLKATLSAGGGPYPVFGLQFTAAAANDGTFILIGNTLKTNLIGVYQYIEHKAPIPAVNNVFQSYFFWTAPPPGAGTINFYATILAANGDHSIIGDIEKNTSIGLQEWKPNAVADLENYASVKSYPNPMNDMLNLSFDAKEKGDYSVAVYNISGQQVFGKIYTIQNNLFETKIDTRSWSGGMYIMEVRKGYSRKTFTLVKQ
jgi:hypothetical protein